MISGCSNFSYPEGGIWVNDELGITIDFDDMVEGEHSGLFRGTIILDDEIKEIIADVCFTGSTYFYFIEYRGKPFEEIDHLYNGWLSTGIHRGMFSIRANMTFRSVSSDRSYTFVRQKNDASDE
jgi:hypothetical protein